MPRLQAKRFELADQVRELPRVRYEVVTLDDNALTLATFQPGWHWTSDLRPYMGTDSCRIHHLGYVLSGLLHVVMDDGQELDVQKGMAYESPPGHDAWVVGDEPWVTLDTTSGLPMNAALDASADRVVATVLFTDIVDSTGTAQRLGDTAWRELLRAHNGRLRQELNIHRGREVATTGDGFLAVFDSATRAIRCAAAMTRSAEALGVAIRVGVHTGEVELVGSDARGLAVHAAARILGLAGPGEVMVSSTTRDLLEGSGIELEDAGIHELKGISGPRQLFRSRLA